MITKRTLASFGLLSTGALAAVAALGVGMPPATAVSPTTVDFTYTGGTQTWVVPAGVTSVTFDVYGAQGGDNAVGCGIVGGLGGHVTSTLTVTPGQSIEIVVGGQGGGPGTDGGAGGFNGGNWGGTGFGTTNWQGAGGGGSSDVRPTGTTLGDRAIVAGGGGGVAAGCGGEGAGGAGGGSDGVQGTPTGVGAAGGGGATASVPGAGGTGTSDSIGGTGSLLNGGPGGNGTQANGLGGGGGGGGYLGGGGGAAGGGAKVAGGGGGGSGFCASTCDATESGVRAGDGLVTVSYTPASTSTTTTTVASSSTVASSTTGATTSTTLVAAVPATAVPSQPTYTG